MSSFTRFEGSERIELPEFGTYGAFSCCEPAGENPPDMIGRDGGRRGSCEGRPGWPDVWIGSVGGRVGN